MRVSINMSDELVKRIDEEAEKLYVSRSAYISMVVAQKLDSEALMEKMPTMIQDLKEMLKGTRNEEESKQKAEQYFREHIEELKLFIKPGGEKQS